MEKVRSVMLALEAEPHPYHLTINPKCIGGIDDASEMVEYLQMLASGGFLEKPRDSIFRVSRAGHEFLDTIRDPDIWRQTKEGTSKLRSWSITLLAELAKGYIRAKAISLGLPLGRGKRLLSTRYQFESFLAKAHFVDLMQPRYDRLWKAYPLRSCQLPLEFVIETFDVLS